jgi:hypothetical protein
MSCWTALRASSSLAQQPLRFSLLGLPAGGARRNQRAAGRGRGQRALGRRPARPGNRLHRHLAHPRRGHRRCRGQRLPAGPARAGLGARDARGERRPAAARTDERPGAVSRGAQPVGHLARRPAGAGDQSVAAAGDARRPGLARRAPRPHLASRSSRAVSAIAASLRPPCPMSGGCSTSTTWKS